MPAAQGLLPCLLPYGEATRISRYSHRAGIAPVRGIKGGGHRRGHTGLFGDGYLGDGYHRTRVTALLLEHPLPGRPPPSHPSTPDALINGERQNASPTTTQRQTTA